MERFALIVAAGGRAVDDAGRNLHRTLEYRATTSIARLLPTGLLLILIGLVLLVLADANDKPVSRGHYLFIALAVTLGLGVIAVSVRARYSPGKPVFTLSPAGIGHRWVRQVLIPWHEVQAIERADIVTRLFNPVWLFSSGSTLFYRTSLFPDVTVIVVSRQFYETVLYVNSFWLRGPGWKGNFIPYGETVQVALHHELVATDRQQLRQAVTSRWLAFRNRATGRTIKTVPAAGPPRVAPEVLAMGDDPRTLSRFQLLQIAVLSAGIAASLTNIAGLWQLDGQGAARQARAEVLEGRRERETARQRAQEEARQRAAEDKRREEENEAVLRRAFGR
jgi:hypothetical protein